MEENQFIELVEQRQGIIHKICRLYRDHPEDRKDLFQEIMFQLVKSLPSFRERSAFSTWMYRIALNTALASFRKKRPRIIFSDKLHDHAAEETPPISFQEEQLFSALKKLETDDRAIIALYLDDRSHRQIAEIIGISENHVAVKLNRIKTKIQKLLN